MTFKTVFDVSQQAYKTAWFPALGLIAGAFGAVLVFRPALLRHFTQLPPHGIAWDLNTGQYSVAEGPVTHFVANPYKPAESFSVNGHRFFYSEGIVIAGFHDTAAHGGPIREGLYVRITYSGNLILRLEVAQ
jgi:hypothetical protein